MPLRCHRMFFVVLTTSILGSISPMTHNWPHYKSTIGPDICTCAHMEAVIEYFKDKNDLTMVLGAGTQEHDYTTRFKNYNFVLSIGDGLEDFKLMTKKLLKSATVDVATEELNERLKNGQTEPLLLWLDFNTSMFNFLDKLPGKFKEIIFDDSVTKFINWKPHHVKHIFDALQDNGEFYFDIEPAGGGIAICFLKPDGTFQIPRPPEYILVLDKFVTYLPPEDLLLPVRFKILTGDKTIQAGEYVKQVDDISPFSVFNVPSDEYVQNYVLGLLKKTGFNAKYMQKAPYPYPNAWGPNPNSNSNFKEYNYILARKPTNIEQNLIQLKDSMVHLDSKLQTVNVKLNTLSIKLKHKTPKQPQKVLSPKEYDYYSENGIQWTFNNQLKLKTKLGVYAQIPGIGIYGDPYKFRKRIFLIEMSDEMLKNIPQPIQPNINKRNVFFYINIVGIKTFLPTNKEFNIVFHGFLALDQATPINDFIQNIPMGIFDPDGISQASSSPITFGKLSNASVHFHSPCFSPNNAKFSVNKNRQLSTFWSVALSPNNNNAVVTYHLLINDETLEGKLTPILEGDNFGEILQQLNNISQIPKGDIRTMQNFVATIKKLIK